MLAASSTVLLIVTIIIVLSVICFKKKQRREADYHTYDTVGTAPPLPLSRNSEIKVKDNAAYGKVQAETKIYPQVTSPVDVVEDEDGYQIVKSTKL